MIAALGTFILTYGTALYMHGYASGSFLYKFGLLLILFTMYTWWRDVIREGTLEGQHTSSVQDGLKLGMLLFIVSEVMFFFAFFWAFFHSSFNPSIFIGSVWPPVFLNTLDPWKVPLLNTLILLASGASVTWAHHSIVWGSKFYACLGLIITITLATIFTSLQYLEYVTAPFNISDSVYGATFYMATGFHGFHVFIGTCFLLVCFSRLYLNQFTTSHHFGFEAAAWYWHFVDVVWLFLFTTVYWWGS
jgi:cytochrome c oxidase subunit 3